jgi:O-antigen ligase/Tfp pilus assembly protein PilF
VATKRKRPAAAAAPAGTPARKPRSKRPSEAPAPRPTRRERRHPSKVQAPARPPATAARLAEAFWPFWALLGVLLVGPLFRGLFFPTEQLIVFSVLVVLTLAVCARRYARGDYRWLSRPIDYAALGMFVAYALATLGAANYRSAVQSDIKWLSYFLAFWLAAAYATEDQVRGWLLRVLAVAGVLVAAVGIGAGSGTIPYPGAYIQDRVYSSFQYPNAAAAYLAAVMFAALAAADGARRWWARGLWSAAAGAEALVFWLTYSRGALLVLPIALGVYWVLQPAGRRGLALVRAAVPLVVGLAFLGPVQHAFSSHAAAEAWVLGVLAALVAGAVDAGVRRATEALGGRPALLGACALAVVGAGVGGLVERHRVAGLLGRLTQLSPNGYNAWSRIKWTLDAIHIWTTRPILGYGGGGWSAVYQKFQSYGYFSTQAHDAFAQILVGTGAVGFLVWIALWVLLIRAAWNVARRGTPAQRMALAPLGAAAAMLGVHGTIDFDLSLSAITLALFSLMGAIRNLEVEAVPAAAGAPQQVRRRRVVDTGGMWRRTATYGLGAVAVACALSLLAALAYGAQGARLAAAGKGGPAMLAYQKAIAYDPLNAGYHAALAAIEGGSGQPQLVADAGPVYQAALRLDPFNATTRAGYGQYLLRAGKPPADAFLQLQQAIALAPYHPALYEDLATAQVTVGANLLNQGKKIEAQAYLKQVNATAALMRAQAARVETEHLQPQALKAFPMPASTPTLQMDQGQADLLLGQRAAGEALLRPLASGSNAQLRGQALLWLGAAESAAGQTAQANRDLAAAKTAIGSSYNGALQQVKKLLTAAGAG